jgi:hypothetical protein
MLIEYLKSTPWETRNLGRESFIVDTEYYRSSNPQKLHLEIRQLIQDFGKIFIFTRVEKSHLFAAQHLEQEGFNFIEQTLEPHIIFSKSVILNKFRESPLKIIPKRFIQTDLKMSLLDKSKNYECDDVFRIASESFSDDRFHMDSRCDITIANQRFVYWVKDLLADKESIFHLLWYKTELAGFMARKNEKSILLFAIIIGF